MKKIFKKNQIIITALAIMIVVAGYLNFVEKDSSETADVGEGQVLDYETDKKTESDNLNDSGLVEILRPGEDVEDVVNQGDEYGDISDEDQGTKVSDTGELIGEDGNVEETEAPTEEGETKGNDVTGNEAASGEGTPTNTNEEGNPGEAVLVSTTASPDYFVNTRISREQMRAKNKDTLMEILDNQGSNEEDKAAATQEIIKLTSISEKENTTETLLEAKGYSDVVVRMSDENINVIVNATSLNDQDVAQIEDIIKRETGAEVGQIVISPVVVTE